MLVVYSIIHFIANGISAFSMSAKYGKDSAYAYLFYGICAYVIPIILGIICDVVTVKIKNNTGLIHRRFYWGVTALGIVFSLLGMYFGLYALGVGNALVIIGSGLGCIHKDSGKKNGLHNIGIWQAAGVPGFWIGKVLADFTSIQVYVQNVWIAMMIIMVVIGFMYIIFRERSFQFVSIRQAENIYVDDSKEKEEAESNEKVSPVFTVLLLTCPAAAFVCSVAAQTINYDWHLMLIPSMLAIIAMSAGRILGSELPKLIESVKVQVIGVLVMALTAICCYVFRQYIVCGIIVQFVANILMAYALYWAMNKYKRLRGLCLGIMYIGFFTAFLLFI